MKNFKLHFERRYDRNGYFSEEDAYFTRQAKNIEKLLPAIKMLLKELEKIPNPNKTFGWVCKDISEEKAKA